MKYCPICDEHYDEEIIKFCTRDGAPLVEDERPSFTALPSENLEEPDFGEETVIRRKPANAAEASSLGSKESERIVIPTSPVPERELRPRAQAYYPPPHQNTAKTIILTILGTLIVLGFGAGLFSFLQREKPANIFANNANANQNTNLNTNLGFDANFNFNASGNFASNIATNLNTNLKTPTPSPSPKPSPSVTPSPSPTASSSPALSPTPRPSPSIRPTPSPTPRTGPRPPTPNANR